ncbi:hypothetical protein EXS74_02945 [Candidatus Woesearchaeota archaeon]|nr:hypothetical protein [Candidatus Woesearchaeota archaeon]
MNRSYRRKIEIYGPLSWPKEISLEEFLGVNRKFMDIVSQSGERIQPDIKAHLRGTELHSLEDLTRHAKTHPQFEGADIHFHTENISCAICTRKKGSKTRDSAILWTSGLAFGAGLLETYYGNGLGTTLGVVATGLGIVGSTYGWREQRRSTVNYLELTIMKRTHNSVVSFREVAENLAKLQV